MQRIVELALRFVQSLSGRMIRRHTSASRCITEYHWQSSRYQGL